MATAQLDRQLCIRIEKILRCSTLVMLNPTWCWEVRNAPLPDKETGFTPEQLKVWQYIYVNTFNLLKETLEVDLAKELNDTMRLYRAGTLKKWKPR